MPSSRRNDEWGKSRGRGSLRRLSPAREERVPPGGACGTAGGGLVDDRRVDPEDGGQGPAGVPEANRPEIGDPRPGPGDGRAPAAVGPQWVQA